MSAPTARASSMATVLGLLAIVAALHLAKSILIPIALAGLLAMLMTPLVRRIEKFGVGPTVSVVVATALGFFVTCAFAWVLTLQVKDFVEKIPEYRTNIVAKTASLGSISGRLDGVVRAVEDLKRQVDVTAQTTTGAHAAPEPPSITIAEPTPTPMQRIYQFIVAWAEPLATAVMVLVLVVFLLVFRRDIGDRIVHVFGPGSVNITSQTIEDAAENVSQYLLMQSIVNGVFGLTVAAGLFGLGVPNALLLGLLAAVLRFIPYVGAWIGLVVPLLLSMAVFDGWTRTIVLLAAWIGLEIVTANVVEPLVYGKRTAVSPLGVLVGALFWGWLWGPAGLVLAVPMTVSVFVLGRNIPQLAFLDTLFGSETALEPSVQFYHRLLAKDLDATVALTDEYGKGKAFVEVCDLLLVPALGLVEVDRHSEALDTDRATAALAQMRRVLEILTEAAVTAAPEAGDEPLAIADDGPPILLIPAADEADEIVALMLSECLSKTGLRAEVLSATATPGDKTQRACGRADALVCISALPPNAAASTRHIYQRIRAKCPGARVVIGAWTSGAGLGDFQTRAAPDGKARMAATLADAVAEIRALSAPSPSPSPSPSPV